MRPLKVALATVGRFHVLDLARELGVLGHDVALHSILTEARAVRFGLPAGAHRGHLRRAWPFMIAQRLGGALVGPWADQTMLQALDHEIACNLEPCDVFIGLSGLCVESARAARERYGAKVFIERGSRHVLSQKAILDDIARRFSCAQTVPAYAVALHEASSDIADYVTVPARHVAESFVEQGYSVERLFLNPYGVDLAMFPPTSAPSNSPQTVVFAGTWSYQKGCDVLAEAMSLLDGRAHLLHVGAVGDAQLPRDDWFEHIDPVAQWQLRDIYARAHLSVVASRQEGLALVQAQAVACGLPLVCTDRTGGADLKEMLGLEGGIFVVPHDNAEALRSAIQNGLEWSTRRFLPGTLRDLLGQERLRLSWRGYGERYARKLEMATGGGGDH